MPEKNESISSLEYAILECHFRSEDEYLLATIDVYEDEADVDDLIDSWIGFSAHFLTRSLYENVILQKFVDSTNLSLSLVVQICRWYLDDHPALFGALDVLASSSNTNPNNSWADFQETLVMLCSLQTLSPFWTLVMFYFKHNVNDQHVLQKLIQSENGIVWAAKEVYDLEHNLEDFLDTLDRVIHL